MSVQEIESAITRLAPSEMKELSRWFDDYRADLWDRQIEADSNAGKLDKLIERANQDFDSGNCRRL